MRTKFNNLSVCLITILILHISCTDDPVTGAYNSYDLIPSNLTASDGSFSDKIAINWEKVSNATGYNLKRRDDPKLGSFLLVAEDIADTFFIDTNPQVGIKYYYKVNAIFSSLSDTSTFSDLEEGYAGILDTTVNDTGENDTTTKPEFIVLKASKGVSDSVIELSWTNLDSGYSYIISASSYEESAYTDLDTIENDSLYIHKNVVPGPYSYKIKAFLQGSTDTLTSSDIGYRKISNYEFFIEVNKTYLYSQSKVGKLTNKELGKETIGGDHHGTLEYNSYLEGLSSAKAILTYNNYKDFYLILNGVQSTNIDGLLSQDGDVSDTVFVEGIYSGFVDHHIDVSGGEPSGGYYNIGQIGVDTSNVQFSDVEDFVLGY